MADKDEKAVAPFLVKTFHLVDHPSTNALISWSPSGTSFIVHKPKELAKHVFPKFFKHDKFTSFVRQLNMYGFSKISVGDTEIEFHNPLFMRGRQDLLKDIPRKKSEVVPLYVGNGDGVPMDGVTTADFEALRSEVNSLKRSRSSLDAEVSSLHKAHAELELKVQSVLEVNAMFADELERTRTARHETQATLSAIRNLLASVGVNVERGSSSSSSSSFGSSSSLVVEGGGEDGGDRYEAARGSKRLRGNDRGVVVAVPAPTVTTTVASHELSPQASALILGCHDFGALLESILATPTGAAAAAAAATMTTTTTTTTNTLAGGSTSSAFSSLFGRSGAGKAAKEVLITHHEDDCSELFEAGGDLDYGLGMDVGGGSIVPTS